MQQPKNLKSLLQALAKQGLDVTYNDRIYSVRLNDSPNVYGDLAAPLVYDLPHNITANASKIGSKCAIVPETINPRASLRAKFPLN